MKVIMLNGSPNEKGCTYTGLSIIAEELAKYDVESELIWLGRDPIQSCTACFACKRGEKAGRCVFDNDMVNTVAEKIKAADGLVLGTPVHYASASGTITAFCDRLFFSTPADYKRMRFGAAIASCRRSGITSTFDQLNKYFTISQMPIVSSCYWSGIHGGNAKQVMEDKEGIRIMKTIGGNMAYLIKSVKTAGLELPEEPEFVMTNFIR